MANRPGMYREIADKYHSIVRPFLQSRHHTGVQCSVNFQPFPAVVGRRSQEHGGNAVGLSANDPDRVLLEIQCAWLAAREDEPGMDTGRQLTEWLDGKMAEWTTPDEEADAYDDDDEYTYEHEDQDQHQHVLGSATRRRRLPSPHPEHDPRDAYLPLIMNEATFDQNVTQRYRDYHHLKAVQARVDPEGFWRTRAGGWTY